MTAHASLAEADLHECKGASTATVGKTIIASGAGAATFKYGNPHGGVYYSDIGVGTTLTYPSAYAKVVPTTVASGMAIEFTEATTARLTYTGTDSLDCRIIANVGFSQSVGAARDIQFALYKNGSIIAGSEQVSTTTSAVKNHVSILWDAANLATNDYIEVYCKNAGGSGDILILSYYLTAFCMRG